MRIADVLRRHGRSVHKIRTTDTVEKATRKLVDRDIDALLVIDRWGRPVGIIGEHDLAEAGERFGEALPDLPVGEVMTEAVVTCQARDRVHKAMALMTVRRIRYLPVKENGTIIGIVTIADLMGALAGDITPPIDMMRDLARSH
jgi:signal-transduction protein with cAMP-binding, CBS, and nucleotidyltransferase domain